MASWCIWLLALVLWDFVWLCLPFASLSIQLIIFILFNNLSEFTRNIDSLCSFFTLELVNSHSLQFLSGILLIDLKPLSFLGCFWSDWLCCLAFSFRHACTICIITFPYFFHASGLILHNLWIFHNYLQQPNNNHVEFNAESMMLPTCKFWGILVISSKAHTDKSKINLYDLDKVKTLQQTQSPKNCKPSFGTYYLPLDLHAPSTLSRLSAMSCLLWFDTIQYSATEMCITKGQPATVYTCGITTISLQGVTCYTTSLLLIVWKHCINMMVYQIMVLLQCSYLSADNTTFDSVTC